MSFCQVHHHQQGLASEEGVTSCLSLAWIDSTFMGKEATKDPGPGPTSPSDPITHHTVDLFKQE